MERRLAAVLFADVVGYTSLMGADEAGTLRRITDLHAGFIEPLIDAHHGRVVKRMGDGWLVEFASVVDAVTCAVSWQSGMAEQEKDARDDKRIAFRIGIHLGDVIVEGSDIHGDGVNLAARLESLARPGGICLSDDAYRQVKGKTDADFEDLGEQNLKNVAEPVRVFLARTDLEADDPAIVAEQPSRASDKPAIAVLPFTNMSGDPGQEYFSDGITEEIITQLTQFRSLSVIARNSSFRYKDQAVRVQDAAQELGVEFLVEGSVRKAGNRVRVTAQLVDGKTGRHVWAQRYDREMEDVFAVQDEVSQTIVATIAGHIDEVAVQRAKQKPPQNMNAYDYFLRGLSLYRMHYDRPLVEAKELFKKSIELDGSFARARAYFALAVFVRVYYAYSGTADLEEALDQANMAVALDNSEPEAHAALGLISFTVGEDRDGLASLRRAVTLNPHDPELAQALGFILTYAGEPEEAARWLQAAIHLNPFPSNAHVAYGISLYLAKRYEEAAEALEGWTRWGQCYWAAAMAQLGHIEDANLAAQRFIEAFQSDYKDRDERPPDVNEIVQFESDFFRRQSDRDHFLDGLRKAGLSL
ncbi:MAG: adenylate/guanylate cyclase domain-containing protein [Pseudomonadota bacterium]